MTRLAASLLAIAVFACSSQRPVTKPVAPAAPVAKPEPAPAPPAPPPPSPEPAVAPDPPPNVEPVRITATDGLPADLVDQPPLWDVASFAGLRPTLHGRRLYRDGRIFHYDDTWRLVARLPPRSLARFQRKLRERIAAGLPDAVTVAPGQMHMVYRSWIDGREHMLLVLFAQPNGAYQLKATIVTPVEAVIDFEAVPISAP